MATLFELKSDYVQVLDMAQDPDVDPQTITDTLESIQGEIEDKAENYVIVMKELEAQKAKWKSEKERAEKYESTCDNNIKRMKEALLSAMQIMGKDKIQTDHFKLAVAKNGGLQPMKITGDVPAEYCRLEPDNGKIR